MLLPDLSESVTKGGAPEYGPGVALGGSHRVDDPRQL